MAIQLGFNFRLLACGEAALQTIRALSARYPDVAVVATNGPR